MIQFCGMMLMLVLGFIAGALFGRDTAARAIARWLNEDGGLDELVRLREQRGRCR